MRQSYIFERAVKDNKPMTGGLNYRTVMQYASELGGVREDSRLTNGAEIICFPDGSSVLVRDLHSGSPRIYQRS